MAGRSQYEFFSCWLLEAPREEVFDALVDPAGWPGWWRGVVGATETDPGDADGIGRRGRLEWRSRIPYPVRFKIEATAIERPSMLAARARGDLTGEGVWRLFTEGDLCAATYSWRVEPGKRWMRAAGPVLGPVLRWNHDQIMRWGAEGLAERLGVRLVAAG